MEFLEDRECKREEEIAYYQKKADIACEEKNGFKKLIKILSNMLSGLNKNEEEYAIIESQISEATGNKIAASNRETGYLLGAFMAASDPIV